MSTILKALERLEKEKQGGAPKPGSATELAVVRPGVPQEPRRRWVWLAGGVGALALTGVLALWLRPFVIEPTAELESPQVGVRTSLIPPAVPPASEEPVAVAAVEPAPAPVPAAPGVEPPQTAPAVAPAAPVEPAPLAAVAPVAEAQPTLPGVAPGEPAPIPEPAPGSPEPARAEVPVVATPAPEPEPVAIDEPEPGPALVEPAAPPPPPAREALRPRPAEPKPRPAPVVARAPDPQLAVERTIWHPDATRRRAYVRLEGRASTELREGDSLGGIAVRRIEPSGVVFVVEGRELRRAVGALP